MKTSPIEVTLINHCGDDLSVVNAARVSFEKESSLLIYDDGESGILGPSDVKLISYLAKHKHFSPFNHTFLSFRVKAPIFVARQLVKHKFMPWNEVSRRYVDSEPEFFIPEGFRPKAENVKQGSGYELMNLSTYGMQTITNHALKEYTSLLEKGVCAEQARMILPQNVMTEWIWSGTLGAFADMLKLRLASYTQKETRDVAQLVYEQVLPLFPVSLSALLENK